MLRPQSKCQININKKYLRLSIILRKRLLIVSVTIFKEYLIVTVTIFKKYLMVTIDFSGTLELPLPVSCPQLLANIKRMSNLPPPPPHTRTIFNNF